MELDMDDECERLFARIVLSYGDNSEAEYLEWESWYENFIWDMHAAISDACRASSTRYDMYYTHINSENGTTHTTYTTKTGSRDSVAEKARRRVYRQQQKCQHVGGRQRTCVKYADGKCVGRQNFNFVK